MKYLEVILQGEVAIDQVLAFPKLAPSWLAWDRWDREENWEEGMARSGTAVAAAPLTPHALDGIRLEACDGDDLVHFLSQSLFSSALLGRYRVRNGRRQTNHRHLAYRCTIAFATAAGR